MRVLSYHLKAITALYSPCTLWNLNYFTSSFVEIFKPFFPCSGKSAFYYPKCGKFYFPCCGKYHKVLATLCMEFSIQHILHIVEHKLFYFKFCGKVYPFCPHSGKYIGISTMWKIQRKPHCETYHKVLSTVWKLSVFLL